MHALVQFAIHSGNSSQLFCEIRDTISFALHSRSVQFCFVSGSLTGALCCCF